MATCFEYKCKFLLTSGNPLFLHISRGACPIGFWLWLVLILYHQYQFQAALFASLQTWQPSTLYNKTSPYGHFVRLVKAKGHILKSAPGNFAPRARHSNQLCLSFHWYYFMLWLKIQFFSKVISAFPMFIKEQLFRSAIGIDVEYISKDATQLRPITQ